MKGALLVLSLVAPGQLDRRHPVRAPGFALDVIDDGSPPAQGRAPLEKAIAGGSLELSKLRGSPVVWPAASSRVSTFVQLDPSAHAPWTRTISGLLSGMGRLHLSARPGPCLDTRRAGSS